MRLWQVIKVICLVDFIGNQIGTGERDAAGDKPVLQGLSVRFLCDEYRCAFNNKIWTIYQDSHIQTVERSSLCLTETTTGIFREPNFCVISRAKKHHPCRVC